MWHRFVFFYTFGELPVVSMYSERMTILIWWFYSFACGTLKVLELLIRLMGGFFDMKSTFMVSPTILVNLWHSGVANFVIICVYKPGSGVF